MLKNALTIRTRGFDAVSASAIFRIEIVHGTLSLSLEIGSPNLYFFAYNDREPRKAIAEKQVRIGWRSPLSRRSLQ